MDRFFQMFGVVIALLLLPQAAFASMWLDESPSCEHPLRMVSEVSETSEPGCDGEDVDDPSSNACFEGAEVPISTLPELITEMQAERIARQMFGRALADLGVTEDEPAALVVSMQGEPEITLDEDPIRNMPRPRAPELACAATPDECKSLPPVPHLELETTSAAGELRQTLARLRPAAPAPTNDRIPDIRRIEAAPGHERELERPPELT